MARETPVRQQYLSVKRQYPNCILFFRLGDFYEMFDKDAEIAARELDLTLTARAFSKMGERVPMAGVPYHAADGYISRLIEKGYHVAICEQMTEPDGRSLVEREVVRVITPGTIIETEMLAEDKPNYLMAIYPVGDSELGKWEQAGLAYADITTGEFATTQLDGENAAVAVLEELARLNPREVLIPETWAKRVTLPEGNHLTPRQDWQYDYTTTYDQLLIHFKTRSLDGFGLRDMPHAVSAAGAILSYLRETQKSNITQLTSLRTYSTKQFMVLDQFTRRNLELTETLRGRKMQGSLLWVLDRTVTAMGARLLHSWVNEPLLDLRRLNMRLDAVESLMNDEVLRQELTICLKQVSDIERLTNRLLIGRAGPRDLLGLKKSLDVVPKMRDLLADVKVFKALSEHLDPCDEVREHIARALVDEPPATLNTIGVIRKGYSAELEDILEKSAHARDWIAQLEPHERRRTGIPTLKVGFNQVFGYYIEVTHAHIDKIPSDYIRKQTLVNAERYITPELKEYETLVLNAEEQIGNLERRLFESLCQHLATFANRLIETGKMIARLDALLSLAQVAVREGYCRPILTDDDVLIIHSGRHPVVERMLDSGMRYVPNDTHFDIDSRIHIITGPNMSGKSTYIRQVALITLMAQIGSFVPADEAVIGLVDRIFARIGAQDEIHAGQSTFMVEMVETARILSGSTRRSLLILDEVGRGTSTYDGLAIARAVIEYIHNNPRLDCRTLFATHYHELTALPNILPRTRNYNVAVSEKGEEIVFLHKVVQGGADKSYGVHVAQIAGMPRPVVERAKQLLEHLEKVGGDFELPATSKPPQKSGKGADKPLQPSLFGSPTDSTVLSTLRNLKVDEMSPIEALTTLYELKRLADSEG
jgi:DNA mismatch repair protein MutS